jgi:hypothetical protein
MNERFENEAMQVDLLDARAVLALKRRKRKHQIPLKTHPFKVLDECGLMREVQLHPGKHPGRVQWVRFPPPSLLRGQYHGPGFKGQIEMWWGNLLPERVKYRQTEFGVEFTLETMPLLVAKIAYTYAAIELGIDAFDGHEIRELLSGQRLDVFSFVGGVEDELELDTDSAFHCLYVRRRTHLTTIIVHLFASYGAPAWQVVVGPTSPP